SAFGNRDSFILAIRLRVRECGLRCKTDRRLSHFLRANTHFFKELGNLENISRGKHSLAVIIEEMLHGVKLQLEM
ncbi:hypothetical protein PENTCL1PPCAC_7941, partial [Pristionchus entomophagus]